MMLDRVRCLKCGVRIITSMCAGVPFCSTCAYKPAITAGSHTVCDTTGGTMKIITNNQPRELVAFDDLPGVVKEDFGYIHAEDRFTPRFVQYRGNWYDTHDLDSSTFPHDKRWHYQSDSFFSGTLFRWPEGDYSADSVIVGRYYE